MKTYRIVATTVCPPEHRWKWRQEEQDGYTITELGSTVRLEGAHKTEEELLKILPLTNEFSDHHIHIEREKEVVSDGEEVRQASSALGEDRLQQRVCSRTQTPLVLCDGHTQRNLTRTDSCRGTEHTCALWSECQRRLRASGDA